MSKEILDFIVKNKDKIETDTYKKLTLKFRIAVNELSPDFFLEPSNIISYSFLYKGENYDYTSSIPEFLSSFIGNQNEVEEEAEIRITIKKDYLKILDITNWCFFENYSNFFKAINDIKIDEPRKKLIVLLLSESHFFSSGFIEFVSIDEMDDLVNKEISNSDYSLFLELNSIFKNKRLNNYLEYPITWISSEDKIIPNCLFSKKLIDCFLSVICNTVLSKDMYLIRGYKSIQINTKDCKNLSNDSACVVRELLMFIIDKQRGHDKLLLLRNTMTLFLNSDETVEGLDDKLDEIQKNVEYNFNAYIQDKIKIFLDQKNKLLQECFSTARKIEDLTNELISQIKTVTFSILGVIFLSLLSSLSQAKSVALLNVVFLSYMSYCIINLLLVRFQKKQMESIVNSLEQFVKDANLENSSLNMGKMKKDYLNETINAYMNYRRWVTIALSILIVLFALLFLTFRFDWQFVKSILKIIFNY